MSKKKMTGREVLEEALRGCCSTYCDQYPRFEGEIDLGNEYEKYVNNLIKRSKNPFQRYFNTVSRRVAGIAAAMLVAFGCSMTVKAVREPVVEFITKVYEKFVEISFGKDDIAKAPKTIETVYTLGIIPEGYIVNEHIIDPTSVYMRLANDNGEKLVFMQGILDGNNVIDNEDSQFEVISANGMKIAYANKNGAKYYFWYMFDYKFTLFVSETISHDTALKLIESVTQYNQ